MNKRQSAAQETKRKLIATAMELLRERGFDAVNVEDITKKAGVAKGTFYTYFKRKEDIIFAISREPYGEIAGELADAGGAELTARLARYFRRFMECVESCGINVCRQWIRGVVDPNGVTDGLDGQKWGYDFDMLRGALERAVERGELKRGAPVELLAHIVLSELYGMMTCWCMSDGAFEPLDWTEDFCRAQIDAVFAPYIGKKS